MIIDTNIDTDNSFFSIIFFIAEPKLPRRKAIIKNLDPLVKRETITKYRKLKCTNPLVIVNNLKGTGVKPAIASNVTQAIVPPSEETLSFKKFVLSTPYNSNIFMPISLKKINPIKYPKHAPNTEPMVAIKAICFHSFFFAIVMGIINTSGGIGKIKLSINDIKPKNFLEFL